MFDDQRVTTGPTPPAHSAAATAGARTRVAAHRQLGGAFAHVDDRGLEGVDGEAAVGRGGRSGVLERATAQHEVASRIGGLAEVAGHARLVLDDDRLPPEKNKNKENIKFSVYVVNVNLI